jgi:cyclase
MKIGVDIGGFALLCLLLCGPSVSAQGVITKSNYRLEPTMTAEETAQVQVRAVPGKDNLYIVPGFGGNSGGNVIFLVTDEGVLVVDNKFYYSYPEIMEQLRKVTDKDIRYMLNTHHHYDHAGSNADFLADNIPILAHRNVRTNVLRDERNAPEGAPRILYDTSATVVLGGQEINAYYFGRGHTSGDSVIHFPALRTIHTGDLVLWGDRLDGSTLSPFFDYDNGGSAADWTATLDGLLTLDFDTAIPGHGPILRKADIRIFRNKLDQFMTRVKVLIDNGVTRDRIVAELDIADLDWPMPPSRIESVYDELTQ